MRAVGRDRPLGPAKQALTYEDGDAEIRTSIVQATLEHLFEHRDVRKVFSGWQKDAVLAEAHAEASEWYKGGGRSPLGRPPFVQE
jgi:hypothetical protein